MQGVSGTSKTGKKHYYYYCSTQRKNKDECGKSPMRKDLLESAVLDVLYGILVNSENCFRIADAAYAYYVDNYKDTDYIGSLEAEDLSEVLELALLSLHTVANGRRCILDVSHAGLTASVVPEHNRKEILQCLSEKNIHGLKAMNAPEEVIRLAEIEGRPSEVKGIAGLEVLDSLSEYDDEIRIDFSAVNDLNYYNGIVFRGFIEGVNESILSGGQYDNLMSKMGHKGVKAIGFALNLDLAAQISGGEENA